MDGKALPPPPRGGGLFPLRPLARAVRPLRAPSAPRPAASPYPIPFPIAFGRAVGWNST